MTRHTLTPPVLETSANVAPWFRLKAPPLYLICAAMPVGLIWATIKFRIAWPITPITPGGHLLADAFLPRLGNAMFACAGWWSLAVVAWIVRYAVRHSLFWGRRYVSPSAGDATITVLGRKIARPAFLDYNRGVFGSKLTPTISATSFHDGKLARVFGLNNPNRINEILRLESLIESVRFEQTRRGLTVTGDAGEVIYPEISSRGVLVERINRRGETVDIFATGLDRNISASEYQEAQSKGIGRPLGAWLFSPPKTLKFIDQNSAPLMSNKITPPVMALFKLDMVAVPVVRSDRSSDPLAPASTEKGGARFAWPFLS